MIYNRIRHLAKITGNRVGTVKVTVTTIYKKADGTEENQRVKTVVVMSSGMQIDKEGFSGPAFCLHPCRLCLLVRILGKFPKLFDFSLSTYNTEQSSFAEVLRKIFYFIIRINFRNTKQITI